MKLLILSALSLGIVAATASAQDLKTQGDSVSYGIGVQIGSNLKQQAINVDPKLLAKGLEDAMAEKAKLTPDQVQAVLAAFQEQHMSRLANENKKRGEEFLAENKKKKGIVTLPSGLQYEVLKDGAGKTPAPTDEVTVHYKGTLVDGKVFDSSIDRGEPATFQVDGVIAGWTEALQKMKEGAQWRLYVPANLAYGDRGAGGAIGPNEVLIFDVELLKVGAAK
jgi:FKBP-type peptidyl-prolyl cis-trans isomerase FklB